METNFTIELKLCMQHVESPSELPNYNNDRFPCYSSIHDVTLEQKRRQAGRGKDASNEICDATKYYLVLDPAF